MPCTSHESPACMTPQAQVALLREYELAYELVGEAAASTQRLRVLPAGYVQGKHALKRTAARVEYW